MKKTPYTQITRAPPECPRYAYYTAVWGQPALPAAVPQLIENGKIFERQKNWKERGYDTVVMIAPLEIGGIKYAGEIIVKQEETRQYFYLHEVQ